MHEFLIALDGNAKVWVDDPGAKLPLENGSVVTVSHAGQQAGPHRLRMRQRSQSEGHVPGKEGTWRQEQTIHGARLWLGNLAPLPQTARS